MLPNNSVWLLLNKYRKSFSSIILVLSITFLTPFVAPASSETWIEVAPTKDGQQWWDKGSMQTTESGTKKILTRFKPSRPNGMEQKQQVLFTMEINCENGLFKDTNVNGMPRVRARWVSSDGDLLIDEVINEVCSPKIT